MSVELGRFLEARRTELDLSRRDVAERSGLSYPYVSQLETGEREPALKAMRLLAPVLEVAVEDLASLVAGGEWATNRLSSMSVGSLPPLQSQPRMSAPGESRDRERAILSVERRLREFTPVERISVLNELIAHALAEIEG